MRKRMEAAAAAVEQGRFETVPRRWEQEWKGEFRQRAEELRTVELASIPISGMSPASPVTSFARLEEDAPELAAAYADHIGRYAHRTINYDPGSATLAEQRQMLASLLRDAVAAEEEDLAGKLAKRRTKAERRADETLTRRSAEERRRFERLLERARTVYPQREDNIFWTDNIPNGLIRRAALEVGRRLDARGQLGRPDDIAYLELDELRTALRDRDRDVTDTALRRRHGAGTGHRRRRDGLSDERAFGRMPTMSPLTYQTSLLAADDEPHVDPGLPGLARTELDRGAWVEHLPGWVDGADGLFEAVLEHGEWRSGYEMIRGEKVRRPRLTWHLDVADLPAELDLLRRIGAVLSERYRVAFTRVGCNLYRDGDDSVAWHGDRIAREMREATIAIVSLGERRPFRLRPHEGGTSLGWKLGRGDLLVMGGTCQRTWKHTVPKVARTGPRISVTYRHVYDR